MLVRIAVGVIVALAYVFMNQMLRHTIPGGTSMFGSGGSTQFTLEEPDYSNQGNSGDNDTFGFSR